MAMRYYAPFPGGGEPSRLLGPHALRIGDAERDVAAADLGEHYAAGRLTLDELNERLDAVFSAKTFGQLSRIMADLPGPGQRPWHARPGGPRGVDTMSATWRSSPLPSDWGVPGLGYEGIVGPAGGPWHVAGPPVASLQAADPQAPPMPTDRAGRLAALSLLLLAMMIWLFTAVLFARHGIYHQQYYPLGPHGPMSHLGQQVGTAGPP